MKQGLFGGTFNPIHSGHVKAAEQILEILDIDRICFIPSNIPPHKDQKELATPEQRYEMVKLATHGNDRFSISDFEISSNKESYTIDTLKYFKDKLPEDDLYFIVGHDIFNQIDIWKEYKKLFELSNFIVISRPGYFDDDEDLPLAIKDDFRYDKTETGNTYYKHKNSNLIIKTQIEGIDISSSEIRELIKYNKSIHELVPPKVEQYIFDNNLYA